MFLSLLRVVVSFMSFSRSYTYTWNDNVCTIAQRVFPQKSSLVGNCINESKMYKVFVRLRVRYTGGSLSGSYIGERERERERHLFSSFLSSLVNFCQLSVALLHIAIFLDALLWLRYHIAINVCITISAVAEFVIHVSIPYTCSLRILLGIYFCSAGSRQMTGKWLTL